MKYLLVEFITDSESGYEDYILFGTKEELDKEIKNLREDPEGCIIPLGYCEIPDEMIKC